MYVLYVYMQFFVCVYEYDYMYVLYVIVYAVFCVFQY